MRIRLGKSLSASSSFKAAIPEIFQVLAPSTISICRFRQNYIRCLAFKHYAYFLFLVLSIGIVRAPEAATIDWTPNGAANSFNLIDGQQQSSATNSCTGTSVTTLFSDSDGAAAAISDPITGDPAFPDFQTLPTPGGRANMQMDATAQNDSTQLVLSFGNQPALNLTFPIFDVDARADLPDDWTDIVQVTAVNGITAVPVTMQCTDPDADCSFAITGNGTNIVTATGEENNTTPELFVSPNGLALVTIAGPVTSVTITYIAGGTLLGPQFIGIGSLNFDCQADLSITKIDSIDPVNAGNPLTYTIAVNNAGPGIAENVVVTDTLPPGVTFQSTSGCSAPNGDPNGIPICSLGTIPANGSAQYTVSVTIDSNTPTGSITNNVSVVSDAVDPAPANNSVSEDTTIVGQNPLLGLAKDLISVTPGPGAGVFTVAIQLTLENFGNVTLTNLQLFDDIVTQFNGLNPTAFNASSAGTLLTNPAWDGTATSNILQAGQSLAAGAPVESVEISFQVTPASATSVENIAIAEGTTPTGVPVTDTSTDGLDPDPNNDNIPNEQIPTPVAFDNPALGVGKDLLSVTAEGNGVFTVTFRLSIENFGNVNLTNLELFDDLVTQFAGLNPINFVATSSGSLIINPNWNGTASSNILQTGQSLAAGAPAETVDISFQVTPGTTTSIVNNLATGRGTPPVGIPVTDISTDGLDPDPNGDNVPSEQTPTPVTLPPDTTENPVIGLAKAGLSLVDNNDGTFDVQYGLTIENSGDVIINNLIITDDIISQFAGFNPTNFAAISALDGSLITNSNWDGGALTNILQPGQSLVPGASSQVFVVFQVTPNGATSVDNLAFSSGESPAGTPVNDTSTDGFDPDPNGDGNPDENVPTPLPFVAPTIPTLNIWALGVLMAIISLMGGTITRKRIAISR